MSMYTIVLHKFTCVLQLGSWQRQLGKTVVIKVGAYLVVMDRKTTVYELKANKMCFLGGKCIQAVHSNMFPYFTGLPVSSSFIASSRARLPI